MKNRQLLLRKLLQALVDEWGYEPVKTALISIPVGPTAQPGGSAAERKSGTGERKKTQYSAAQQIEKTTVEGAEKEALLRLAERYDHKQFLPSLADVREFLIMMGERPTGMKDRKEAFRVLLQSLRQLPVERLHKLVQTAQHSGPSDLGSLSDAIAEASKGLPRRQGTTQHVE